MWFYMTYAQHSPEGHSPKKKRATQKKTKNKTTTITMPSTKQTPN